MIVLKTARMMVQQGHAAGNFERHYNFSQKPHTRLMEGEGTKKFLYCQNSF